MTKRSFLLIAAIPLLIVNAWATTPGADFANDPAYDPSWTDTDDGGTAATFNAWSLQSSGTGTLGYVVESSATGGGGDINTGGEAFGLYAVGGSNFANAYRSFDVALQPGQTFSFDLSVRYRDGNKGFNLRVDNSSIFNLNIGANQYVVSGAASGNGPLFGNAYSDNTIFSIQFTQTDLTTGTWTITRTGGLSGNTGGMYTGTPNNFQFYVGETGSADGPANNLYFNNLVVTAVPEPSTISLFAASAIFGACFYARRRSR